MPRSKGKTARTPPPPLPGELCRTTRQRLGLTQSEIARKASVTQARIAALEGDAAGQPGALARVRIATALGLDPEALLTPAQRKDTRAFIGPVPARPGARLVCTGGPPGSWRVEEEGHDARDVRGTDLGMVLYGLAARGVAVLVEPLAGGSAG